MRGRSLICMAILQYIAIASPPVQTRGGPNTQVPEGGLQGPGGAKFNVSIVNETQQQIQFLLRSKEGAWANYSLEPNEKGVYSCFGCNGQFDFSMNTNGVVVSYQVLSGNLYAIREDASRRIYDVFRTE